MRLLGITKELGILLLFWLLKSEFDYVRVRFIEGALVSIGFNLFESTLHVVQSSSILNKVGLCVLRDLPGCPPQFVWLWRICPLYQHLRSLNAMNARASFSKPKIAVLAAFIYTTAMGVAMFYMKTFRGITYGAPEMMTVFWVVLLGLNLLNVFWVTRYFSWQEIGFRSLNRKQLLWFLPSIAVLIAMWVVFLSGLAKVSLSGAQWQLFAIAGFTTLLVGIGEETMYRGIVLHAFLTTNRVRWAMLVSAISFSLLHAVNVFGGILLLSVPMQLIMTFLFGFLFAPLMLKLNNIVPLILFHWLWDFVVFAAPLLSEQVQSSVSAIALLNIPIEIIVGIVLWRQIKQVPERAIGDFSNSLLD